jgi:hypothetical protein
MPTVTNSQYICSNCGDESQWHERDIEDQSTVPYCCDEPMARVVEPSSVQEAKKLNHCRVFALEAIRRWKAGETLTKPEVHQIKKAREMNAITPQEDYRPGELPEPAQGKWRNKHANL